jgi:hypothetical protein
VNQPADRLRETFETHETQAPDPGVVYARVQQLARRYQRRRRGAQVAGTAVLGAGLLAGAAQLPGVLSGTAARPGIRTDLPAAAAPSVVPSVVPSRSGDEAQRDLDAYFAAGYGYDEAVRLASLWHSTADIGDVKAEAGRRLLAGETLPVRPAPQPTSTEPGLSDDESAAYAAFFDAGYVWDDAVRLAHLWHLADPSDAKVRAGHQLAAHRALPFRPKPANVRAARDEAAVEKFFHAGYDVDDAAKLGRLWHVSTWQAKIQGGERLLAGGTLPFRP